MPNKVVVSLCASCDRVLLTIGGIRFETQADSLAQAISIAVLVARDLGISVTDVTVENISDEKA